MKHTHWNWCTKPASSSVLTKQNCFTRRYANNIEVFRQSQDSVDAILNLIITEQCSIHISKWKTVSKYLRRKVDVTQLVAKRRSAAITAGKVNSGVSQRSVQAKHGVVAEHILKTVQLRRRAVWWFEIVHLRDVKFQLILSWGVEERKRRRIVDFWRTLMLILT